VADGSVAPIDKPCGEGLMPDGLAALAALGVEIPAGEARPFRGIRFCSGDDSVAASFPNGHGFGIRRTVLHRIMAEAAERAGVHTLWRSVVTGLEPGGVRVSGELVRARWVVGADGGHSRVRRWAQLDQHQLRSPRYAFRRHYRMAPWADFMELHWGPGCELYVTSVAHDEVCVALISRDPKLRLDPALRHFPLMSARVAGKQHASEERGAVTVSRRLRRVSSGNVALVGDASGGVDAITGEGLCLAFKQARLLASCMADGSLAGYQRGHRALMRRPAAMARLMLMLDGRPWLRGRVMKALMRRPQIFESMLATHVGEASAARIAETGLALGWELL
jgi:flavin-dependent dehydrogenase